MFYEYNTIRSYNKFYNFILSNRGGGKTYGAKMIGIKSWIKNKEQFAYVRRFKSEFETINLFFNDIVENEEFPEYEFKTDKKRGYIKLKSEEDWHVLCHFFPLSIQQNFKSTPYPNVTKIFYDEFLIDKGTTTYLPNEVVKCLELTSTIVRKRTNVKFFFLANNISLVNPYFTYFDIKIAPNNRFTVPKNNPQICVELFTNDEFVKEMEETPFGQLIKGTTYGDYAISNNSLKDNNHFILEKRPSGQMKFICSFKIGGLELGLWQNNELGIIYVDKKIDINSLNRYTLTNEEHSPEYKMITLVKSKPFLVRIKKCYAEGLINFSDQEVKNTFIHALRYI